MTTIILQIPSGRRLVTWCSVPGSRRRIVIVLIRRTKDVIHAGLRYIKNLQNFVWLIWLSTWNACFSSNAAYMLVDLKKEKWKGQRKAICSRYSNAFSRTIEHDGEKKFQSIPISSDLDRFVDIITENCTRINYQKIYWQFALKIYCAASETR